MKKLLLFIVPITMIICALFAAKKTPCLEFNGHAYRDGGVYPAPIPGASAQSPVALTVNGTPAWWLNGRVYIRAPELDCHPQQPSWAAKMPKSNLPTLFAIACVLVLGGGFLFVVRRTA